MALVDEGYVTVAEAAGLLSVSRSTLCPCSLDSVRLACYTVSWCPA